MRTPIEARDEAGVDPLRVVVGEVGCTATPGSHPRESAAQEDRAADPRPLKGKLTISAGS